MMYRGVHWNNNLWQIDEADFAKVAPFDSVLVIIAAFGGNLYHIQRQYQLCQRLHNMGKELVFRIESRGFENVPKFVDKWAPILTSLLTFGQHFQLNNEPNLKGEFFGGSSDIIAQKYNDYFLELAPALKSAVPGIQIGFPGLAVAQNDLNWLLACRPAIEVADWVASHIYWQYEAYNDPTWGRRYEYIQEITQKPIFITEYGDSTPARPIEEKAKRYRAWFAQLPSQIKRAYCFILSSPNDEWKEFVLTDKAIEIMLSAGGQKEKTMEFELAFAEYQKDHPEIGDPDSPMSQVTPNDVCQRTTTGVLWYRDGEGVTFYPKA